MREPARFARPDVLLPALVVQLAVLTAGTPLGAQTRDALYAASPQVQSRNGAGVYREVCQACHMPEGRGAKGAAAYPALARNPKLEAAGYPLTLVMHGQKAMPAFAGILSDEQAANVVNYIRTRFGNRYRDRVTAEDARALR